MSLQQIQLIKFFSKKLKMEIKENKPHFKRAILLKYNNKLKIKY